MPKPGIYFRRYGGPAGRRLDRVSNAFVVGLASVAGDACPYHKRAYVAAWLHGIAEQRGLDAPRVWRPRIQAEVRRDFRLDFDRTLRRSLRQVIAVRLTRTS